MTTTTTTPSAPKVLPPWLYHSHPAYLHEFHHHYLPQVKPPVPPPKDPAYLEALRLSQQSGSRTQFHLHGGVISSGEEHGVVGHSKRRDSPRSTTGKSASNNSINNTSGGQTGAGAGGRRGRKGLEKLRAANRAFLNKLQSVKQMSLWPSSKHFCWSSIATASDPSPLTSHMHTQYMQHQQQQGEEKYDDHHQEKKIKSKKMPEKNNTPENKEKKKRRSFFPSLNSKRTRRPDHAPIDAVAALSPAPASTSAVAAAPVPVATTVTTTATNVTSTTTFSSLAVPSHGTHSHASTNGNNGNNNKSTTVFSKQQTHLSLSSRLLAAGTAAGSRGVATEGVAAEAGATPSPSTPTPTTTTTSSSSSSSSDSRQYEYPQYQQLQQDSLAPQAQTPPASKSSVSSSAVVATNTSSSSSSSLESSLFPTFVTGPEHWYHLALQLESSVLLAHQLQAKHLFTRAAELGFAPAQFKLGICYELGLVHCPMDPSQSFHWYRQAALQGHADAELAISGWYLTGHSQGLGQSDSLAYEWAHKAALRGWSKAEYTLGHYHEVGIGVVPDLALAQQWYLKAASRGNERALLRLLVGHVGLEVDYAHLKDALLALNQTNPYLIHQLAQFHELREYGLVPDEETAFELYAASAQADYAPAQYKLGACYEFGILGCPQDPVQAVEWYRRGADNGHVEALLALAGFFLDGSAGQAAPQSDEEAFRYVRMAALRGVPKAEYIAGFFLEYGLGNARHVEQAKQWYRLACAKGVESAERRLCVLEQEATR
ncbi:hypothetical protein BGZ73_004197 [Actinomortierella ambigua]|nr:hypothetical protein BGZ73_004197 [Actinomortierella ambigua]